MYYLFALVLYFCALCSANSYVTMKVEPKSEECFYEDLQNGQLVEFDYHVIDGGLLDVDIRVCSMQSFFFCSSFLLVPFLALHSFHRSSRVCDRSSASCTSKARRRASIHSRPLRRQPMAFVSTMKCPGTFVFCFCLAFAFLLSYANELDTPSRLSSLH
jgi:hypothetical protein